jgi:hypothetical protein
MAKKPLGKAPPYQNISTPMKYTSRHRLGILYMQVCGSGEAKYIVGCGTLVRTCTFSRWCQL